MIKVFLKHLKLIIVYTDIALKSLIPSFIYYMFIHKILNERFCDCHFDFFLEFKINQIITIT